MRSDRRQENAATRCAHADVRSAHRSRRYDLRMARNTSSEPDCSGMCSDGMTAGVSAIAAMTSSVKSRGCGLVNRTRSKPSTAPTARSNVPNADRSPNSTPYALTLYPRRVTSTTPSATSAATSARMSPGRRSRSRPRSAGTMQNVQVLLQPTLTATQAEYALLPPRRQCRRKDLQRLGDLHLRLVLNPGSFQQHRQRSDVVGAEDDVNPGRSSDDLGPVLLGQAAANGDLHARCARFDRGQVAEVAVELVVGVLPNCAGVEDDDVGRLVRARVDVAGLLEQPGEALGVVDVHLAPVGADVIRTRAHLGL